MLVAVHIMRLDGKRRERHFFQSAISRTPRFWYSVGACDLLGNVQLGELATALFNNDSV